MSAQGVDNVLARIQQRIEEELSRVRVLGLTELVEEKGALRDLPLCFLEHDLSPNCEVLCAPKGQTRTKEREKKDKNALANR